MISFEAELNSDLEELRQRNLFRAMPEATGLPGRVININGYQILNFSSNNYLGLADHPEIAKAMYQAAVVHGSGSTASRLIAGNTAAHLELEDFIARWKGTEAALTFNSGYQANVGTLTAIANQSDLIISDELNHASIIDGSRLSRARVKVYRHCDMRSLEDCLKITDCRRKIVVTESIFSMDGDRAPLREIWALCQEHGAALMVDEAHATGVFGPQGQGMANELDIRPDIQMGTLGKAAGVSGAYIAGAKTLMSYLTNKARSLIYTTAPSPAIAGACLAALKIVSSDYGAELRNRLKSNIQEFHVLLHDAGLNTSPGHIVPIMIGSSQKTMEVSRKLMENGVFAHGIRYPTVPEGTARLRMTLMSTHMSEDLKKAAGLLKSVISV
jgi:8-amino-7-oxononanoate synthase